MSCKMCVDALGVSIIPKPHPKPLSSTCKRSSSFQHEDSDRDTFSDHWKLLMDFSASAQEFCRGEDSGAPQCFQSIFENQCFWCSDRSSADTSILFTDSLVKTLDEDFARIDNEYADMAMYPTSGTSCMRPMMRETGKDDKMQGSLPQRADEAKPSHRKSYDAVLSQSVKAKAKIRQPFALR